MPEEVKTVQAGDLDTKMDQFLDKADAPPANTEQEEHELSEDAEETTQAAESKETENADASKGIEEKLAKIKEILGDDEEAVNAYIKKSGFHNHPAWKKLQEKVKSSTLPKELQDKVELVNQTINDPEFIRFRMQRSGYKDEAIDKHLKSLGYEVSLPEEDDLTVVANGLGMKVDQFAPETRDIVSDIAKITKIMFNNMLEKVMPGKLNPLSSKVDSLFNENMSERLVESMKSKVEKDGDLSWKEDVEPMIYRFLDDNPNAKMEDVRAYFLEQYPEMRIERVKLGKRKSERDDIKKGLVKSESRGPAKVGTAAPKKTGNIDADMDAFFDYKGYRE